jgi:CRP-like cAMP-binding protein
MELIGRMLDGSIPYSVKGLSRGADYPQGRMSQEDKISHLEELPLLEGSSRRQLKAVAKIAEIREVPEGTVLTRRGAPGDEFFLIIDGQARVEVSPRKRMRLAPGDFFGEMSLIDGGPRSATVVADTAMRLLIIDRRHFARLLAEVPELSRTIMTVMARRLRHAEQAPNA